MSLDLQTALAAEAHLVGGATEHNKVTYVTSWSRNIYCFEERRPTFSSTKNPY
jgi:hypothetical protein